MKGIGGGGRLALEIAIDDHCDTFEGMERTYRDEGLSVGPEQLRVLGNEIKFNVGYNELSVGRRIGQGACSNVNIAVHKTTGAQYAIKIFNVYDYRQADQLKKEVLTLTHLNSCDALISFEGCYHHEGTVGIVLEYMDKGSLEYFVHSRKIISESVLASITYQILWGLGYLHYEKILHRDVKPANVLFNSSGFVKLSDFGISKQLGSTDSMSNTSIGTCCYMSPERLLGQKYDASGDIWSLGVIMLELWNQEYPFKELCATPVDLIMGLETFAFDDCVANMPSQMRALVLCMLSKNPKDRQNCIEMVESPWFADCGVLDLDSAHEIVKAFLITEFEDSMSKSAGANYKASNKGYGSSNSLVCVKNSNHGRSESFDEEAYRDMKSCGELDDEQVSTAHHYNNSNHNNIGSSSNEYDDQYDYNEYDDDDFDLHKTMDMSISASDNNRRYRIGGESKHNEYKK